MEIKFLMRGIKVINPDYDFPVYGENKEFHNNLCKWCDGIGEVVSIRFICPEKKAYSFNFIMREMGYDPDTDDADRMLFARKLKRLFSLFGFDTELFQDDKGTWILTEDEKEMIVDFLKDFSNDYVLYKSFLKQRKRPENIQRRNRKEQEKDVREYKDWLNGKERLSSLVRILWYMCSNRNLLGEPEIKRKFTNLPFELDCNVELKRMELKDSMAGFVTDYFDKFSEDINIADREKLVYAMVEDMQRRMNYWKNVFFEMNQIYHDPSFIKIEHLVGASPLLEQAIGRTGAIDISEHFLK